MPVGAEDLCDFFGACPAAVPNEQAWAKAAREVMRNPAVRQCAATGWWAGAPCVFMLNNVQVNNNYFHGDRPRLKKRPTGA